MLRGIIKTLLLWSVTAGYLLYSAAGHILFRSQAARIRFALHSKRFFSTLGLRIMGVHISETGRENKPGSNPALVISNHVSYIDILLISSLLPGVFVAAIEWAGAPLIGWISRLGASIFVRRQSRADLRAEIDAIGRTLEQGFTVVLFPESTSSDGTGVLPFKSALLAAAERMDTPVMPMCIRYTRINGAPVDEANKHRIHFYRPLRLLFHALKLPFLRSVDAAVTYLQPLDRSSWHTRKELAKLCEERIKAAYFAE
jgi:1-acyl-sn-glycerol-3-phosphate acyltransferase